jgi:hypothetical protein
VCTRRIGVIGEVSENAKLQGSRGDTVAGKGFLDGCDNQGRSNRSPVRQLGAQTAIMWFKTSLWVCMKMQDWRAIVFAGQEDHGLMKDVDFYP